MSEPLEDKTVEAPPFSELPTRVDALDRRVSAIDALLLDERMNIVEVSNIRIGGLLDVLARESAERRRRLGALVASIAELQRLGDAIEPRFALLDARFALLEARMEKIEQRLNGIRDGANELKKKWEKNEGSF